VDVDGAIVVGWVVMSWSSAKTCAFVQGGRRQGRFKFDRRYETVNRLS
jgi:hypothetical protein